MWISKRVFRSRRPAGLLKCFMIKIAAAAVLRGLLKRFAEIVSLIETRYFNFKSALPDSIF
jgi:hypothetical protein